MSSAMVCILSVTSALSSLAGYGSEHAQCVPPSEFSEPSFITESYQTLHPISSEELLSLKYETDYPSPILRDPLQPDSLQGDYFTIKQEVVSPDNMCVGRISRGKRDPQTAAALPESEQTYKSPPPSCILIH